MLAGIKTLTAQAEPACRLVWARGVASQYIPPDAAQVGYLEERMHRLLNLGEAHIVGSVLRVLLSGQKCCKRLLENMCAASKWLVPANCSVVRSTKQTDGHAPLSTGPL